MSGSLAGLGGQAPGRPQAKLVQEDIGDPVVIVADQVAAVALEQDQVPASITGRIAAGAIGGDAQAYHTHQHVQAQDDEAWHEPV